MNTDQIPKLRVPQARVLRALVPVCPTDTIDEWPLLTRKAMAILAGYSEISGSITRALMGIRATNKSSGDPHKGLIELGLVQVVELEVEQGIFETNYRATIHGMRALRKFLTSGGRLPAVRERGLHVNHRFREAGAGATLEEENTARPNNND